MYFFPFSIFCFNPLINIRKNRPHVSMHWVDKLMLQMLLIPCGRRMRAYCSIVKNAFYRYRKSLKYRWWRFAITRIEFGVWDSLFSFVTNSTIYWLKYWPLNFRAGKGYVRAKLFTRKVYTSSRFTIMSTNCVKRRARGKTQ